MSAFKKTDIKGRSLFGIVFFAILIALIGAVSGFILLASTSPEPFGSVAEYESDLEGKPQPNILNAHYFQRPEAKLGEWAPKREFLMMANDTAIELTDSEINAWIANKFEKSQVSFTDEEEPKAYVVTGLPNCLIDLDDGVHFNMRLKMVIFGKQFDYLLIGQGHFSGEDPVEFHLSRLRLNEALIPFSKKQHELLLGFLLNSLYASDEFIALKDAWEKVDSVELIENGIRLNLDE